MVVQRHSNEDLYDALKGWGEIPLGADPRVYRRVVVGPARSIPDGAERCHDPSDLADASVHDLLVFNTVERVPDLVAFWKNCHRALVLGGTMRVSGAFWSHMDCHSDPTRIRGLSERMFVYLSKPWRESMRNDPAEDDTCAAVLCDVNFEIVALVQVGEPDWDGRAEEARSWAATHFNNVVRRLDVTLRKNG